MATNPNPPIAWASHGATRLSVRSYTKPQRRPETKVDAIPIVDESGKVDIAVPSSDGKKCHKVKASAVTTMAQTEPRPAGKRGPSCE
mgnify:CR=1 FL=1